MLYTRTVTTVQTVSGLVGAIGVTVLSDTGATLVTRITTLIEFPTNTYRVDIPNFDTAWNGTIVWDGIGVTSDIQTFTGTGALALPLLTAYISVYDASLYFQTRLGTDAWDNATPIDQAKSLAQATRSVERLNFAGIKVDPNQPFQWPRVMNPRRVAQAGTPIFPQDIKFAICEIALNLLDGVDADLEDELLGSMSDAYATVRVTSDPKVARDHIKAGIISVTAWRLLLPWLQDPRTVHIQKV